MQLVLSFALLQSIHYYIWLHAIPNEAIERETPTTFRASYASLKADFGETGLVVAASIAGFIALWAVWDLAAAHDGYFRMVRFHGHLEVLAVTALWVRCNPLEPQRLFPGT